MLTPKDLLEEAIAMKETTARHRQYLHLHPEIGFALPDTTAYVHDTLTSLGYTPTPCGKSGIIANIGRAPSPTVLLRADMDALETKSGEAKHLCGHDMHTAMLLSAAELLKRHEASLHGSVRLMFQPAEESLEGARDMLKDDRLLSGVDAAVMLHVLSGVPLKTGTVILPPPGPTTPAVSTFAVKLRGKGCHGAFPEAGIDPLLAGAHVLLALESLITRESPTGDNAVLTIGHFSAGAAPNAIPDTAVLEGTVRAIDSAAVERLHDRIRTISEGIATAMRASAEIKLSEICPPLTNDPSLLSAVKAYLRELLPEEYCIDAEALNKGKKGSSGSEDFAYLSPHVPTLMLTLVAGKEQNGVLYPQHHPLVAFDDEALPIGAAIYAYSALRLTESLSKTTSVTNSLQTHHKENTSK